MKAERPRYAHLKPKPPVSRFASIAPATDEARLARPEKPATASAVFALAYMALMAVSVLYPYFRIVSLPWFTMHAAYILIIGMAFLWVFVTGNFMRVVKGLVFLAIFGGLYIIMMVHSLGVWILDQDGMSLIKRGIGTLLYQFLGIMAVCAAYVLFGERALTYTFWGYVGGNLLLLMSAVVKVGASDFVSQIVAFYMSFGGEDNPASKALEVHDLTFAFGEFVILYLCFAKNQRGRIVCLIVATGFFLLGWKRIAIPGIALACVYTIVMRRIGEKRAVAWTTRAGLIMVGFSFVYIIIIREGLYAATLRALGIDTMGRIELLNFIKRYYTISPTFMGYGIGFITRMMQDYIESGEAVLNAAMSIHNDILARYIELGFLGFTVWAAGLFVITPRLVRRYFSHESMILFFAAMLYCFMTYLTDNTAGYFHINFCLRLFPLALAAPRGGAQEGALNE